MNEVFQKIGFKVHFYRPSQKRRLPRYEIRISSLANTLAFLEMLLPYLRIKKEEASLMISFCKSRLGKPVRSPYTEEEFRIFQKIREMHTKGRKKRKLTSEDYYNAR